MTAGQQRDGVLGDYWFYPVGCGPARVVRAVPARTGVPPGGRSGGQGRPPDGANRAREGRTWDRLVFDSSEVFYHLADKSPGHQSVGPFEVAKYVYSGYGDDEGPQRTEEWRRIVPIGVFSWAQAPTGRGWPCAKARGVCLCSTRRLAT